MIFSVKKRFMLQIIWEPCSGDLLGGLLSGVGWRVGTPAVGGLGTVTHLNVGDIMKENGRACKRETNLRTVCFISVTCSCVFFAPCAR